jgi:tRNA-dihydrouridine synthase B
VEESGFANPVGADIFQHWINCWNLDCWLQHFRKTFVTSTVLKIGPYSLQNRLVAAPMAGVTDRPFRQLCRRLGAGLAVSEMLTSDVRLWNTRKSRLRMDHRGEPGPVTVQIAGADPEQLATAARLNVEYGADIIDINMGCPAKKVCNVMAGSALLENEDLVGRILDRVVAAVEVPVTLKIRTGPTPETRNAERIARLAEDAGIQALTIHGRCRSQKYQGEAEHQTTARIKQQISIPVIANGDIDTPLKAEQVLRETAADGLMIGRGAQGNPWIFQQIEHYLQTGTELPGPGRSETRQVMFEHLQALHEFYGENQGLRVARKHLGWYLKLQPGGGPLRRQLMRIEKASEQFQLLADWFSKTTLAQVA